uniref:Uncharacterized protein n=1 Tax=Arundo donax TaxID=35708 RepID=A0A0A9Q215_ARUDO
MSIQLNSTQWDYRWRACKSLTLVVSRFHVCSLCSTSLYPFYCEELLTLEQDVVR